MKFSPIPESSDIHEQARHELFPDAQAGEILFVPLRDRVVDCDLRIHCFAERSVDQLLGEVRALLSNVPEGLSFSELLNRTGCQSRLSSRVVSEVLRVLEGVGEIHSNTDLVFRAVPTALGATPERETVFDRRFRYVPRSRQLAPDIPALTSSKLQGVEFEHNLLWWRPPAQDEQDLYAYTKLASEISSIFAEQFHEQSLPRGEGGARNEPLQRSRLISTGLRFAGVSITRLEKLDRWVVHSGYLFRSSGPQDSGWNVRVYRHSRGGEQHGYTRYLTERMREKAEYIDSLKAFSVRI